MQNNKNLNTIIWAFNDNYEKIVYDLQKEGFINPKFWILKKDNEIFSDVQYNIHTFFSDDWLETYKDKIKKYEQGVPFNREIYDKVYHNFLWFQDQYSRHDRWFQNKKLHSFLNIFNLFYKFIYSVFVKDNIEFCLFEQIPHEGIDLIIYSIAKALNIPTLILFQSAIPSAYNKIFYMDSIEDVGDFKLMTKKIEDSDYKIKPSTSDDYWYMNNIELYSPQTPERNHIMHYIKKLIKYGLLERNKFYKLERTIDFNEFKKFFMANTYVKKLESNIVPADYSKKYVYFPLHLQPELTTSSLGGIFNDQCLAIEIISEMLPDDWYIYVKENPKQTEFMRDTNFFERIKLLDNVKIVPRNENSNKLIKNSQFVATITGTAGWEALCEQKPVLIFGNSWYKNFEGAFKYDQNDKELFNKISNKKIDLNKLEENVRNLLSRMPNCMTDTDFVEHFPDYDEDKNFNTISQIIKEQICVLYK